MSINILISKWEQTWFNFKVRTSLSANGRDIELFSTELLFDKRCHALPWYQYHKNHEENQNNNFPHHPKLRLEFLL